MPNPITLSLCTFDLTVSPEQEDALCAQLIAYNKAHAPRYDGKEQYASAPLHIYALNEDGEVIGGVVGTSHFVRSWLNISLVYVTDKWRGHGLGRELMARAEAEAMNRGCRYARLATGDYQAPGFYEKLGYVLYGTLEDCPPGETVYYYRKDLNSE